MSIRPLYKYEIYLSDSPKEARNTFHRYAPIKRNEIERLMVNFLASGKQITVISKTKKLKPFKNKPSNPRFANQKLFKDAVYRNWDEAR